MTTPNERNILDRATVILCSMIVTADRPGDDSDEARLTLYALRQSWQRLGILDALYIPDAASTSEIEGEEVAHV